MPSALFSTFAGRGSFWRGFCLAVLLVLAAGCATSSRRGWRLVWHDEFEGAGLDPARWEFEVDAKGGGNAELQYYVTNNVSVRDGLLCIEARKGPYTGPEGTRGFTSSRIRTKKKGDWKYGRFEIRAKLPQGRGIWPAIWMLPTDNVYGGWPHSGEIDIMELLGHEPNRIYGTLHYSDREQRHTFRGTNCTLAASTFADEFHVFRVEWQPGVISWYLDDQLYQTQTDWLSGTNSFPSPFDQRFHLILNLAVGGNWPGSPDATTVFPQGMMVDYVRVYRHDNVEASGPVAQPLGRTFHKHANRTSARIVQSSTAEKPASQP